MGIPWDNQNISESTEYVYFYVSRSCAIPPVGGDTAARYRGLLKIHRL